MPVSLKTIKNTHARVFLHTCEVCHKEGAFGRSASLKSALKSMSNNNVELAKELLGKWYCKKHWSELNK